MTLRWRLTLWYSLVLAGVLGLVGTGVYVVLQTALMQSVDERVRTTADQVAAAGRVGLIWAVTRAEAINAVEAPQLYAQVWWADGQLASPGPVADQFLVPPPPEMRPVWRVVLLAGKRWRVLAMPLLTVDRQLAGYLQVTAALETQDNVLQTVQWVLWGSGGVAVLLVALLGWLAAPRALAPLESFIQLARQITQAEDLSQRMTLPARTVDEVSRLAEAFNAALAQMERLVNTQRRFVADVSHELRTPLTTIRGNADLLRRMGGADPTSLDAIQSEAERMSRLVGGLLLLAQADLGKLPLAQAPVPLDTLLLEVLRETHVLAGGVQVSLGEIDQISVVGDRDRLKQLLLNLVSNALKFTPEGGRVTLGLARVDTWARFTVADTGLGIPPAELPRIFDRFYRVDKARSRALGGAGLGLAIAQRIAHMHGGRIEAASDGVAGHGATFSVWLPLPPV